mgnify:CR=1 FL=1|tara:strand:+ start:245 stop:595 length:351 start_codon:yes stop_codon:yes gene_type:complete
MKNFIELLLLDPNIINKEEYRGPNCDTFGFFYDGVSIHIEPNSVRFCKSIHFDDIFDCPAGHITIGIDDDDRYFVSESICMTEVLMKMPPKIQAYMIMNLEKFTKGEDEWKATLNS